MPTVSNSSPLIALVSIGRLKLLPALFHSISIPPAVASEIAPAIRDRPAWLQVLPLSLDALKERGFFMSPGLYGQILTMADEPQP